MKPAKPPKPIALPFSEHDHLRCGCDLCIDFRATIREDARPQS